MPSIRIPFIASHPDFTLKLPDKHRVPIQKYSLLPKKLLKDGLASPEDFYEPEPADIKYLTPIHEPDYLRRALNFELTAKEARRIGYPYNEDMIRRELRIVEGTVSGADIALKIGFSYNVGGGSHHAGSDWGEGFCTFNDVAAAAYHLKYTRGIEKILIIDLDVHQGNGTAEILQNEPNIFTFSMHAQNNFPFRKENSDLDIGLEDNAEGEQYLDILSDSMEQIDMRFKPDFIFYLAGADVLESDRLGRLSLTKKDCLARDRLVFDYCRKQKIPIHVSTAGGYSEGATDTVDVHAQTFRAGLTTLLKH